jgi:hypothetical protein
MSQKDASFAEHQARFSDNTFASETRELSDAVASAIAAAAGGVTNGSRSTLSTTNGGAKRAAMW